MEPMTDQTEELRKEYEEVFGVAIRQEIAGEFTDDLLRWFIFKLHSHRTAILDELKGKVSNKRQSNSNVSEYYSGYNKALKDILTTIDDMRKGEK